MHFTIELDYDEDHNEDLGGAARGLAWTLREQDGVSRVKVYAEGELVAEGFTEDLEDSMDPNVTLTRIRKLRDEILARPNTLETREGPEGKAMVKTYDVLSAVQELAELTEALDEWIVKGGFVPDDWQPTSAPAFDGVDIKVFADGIGTIRPWTVTANFYPLDNHRVEADLRTIMQPEGIAYDSEAGQFFAYTDTAERAQALVRAIGQLIGRPVRIV